MTLLVKIILTLTLLQSSLESNILVDENVKLSLQYLCPGVDICNKNESDPKADHKEIDERGYMSCCQSCSCNKKCHMSMNCCFPGIIEELSNTNTSFTFENGNAPGNSSLTRDRHSSPVDTNEIMHATRDEITDIRRETTTINEEIITVDKDNDYIDIDLAAKQCIYTQTGTPNEYWVGQVPAYRIVTSPPPGGCKSNILCPALTQENNQATCNSEDVFPWGDLFPVYNAEYKLIFKNELCACCYGVIDYTPWLLFLECDEYDSENRRDIPISEHLRFLQKSNSFSNHCMVAFHDLDTRVLLDNHCYMNTIGTCQFSADVSIPLPEGVNLTRSEIVKACYSGPDAPFHSRLFNRVYKNVFCAMCNTYVNLQCFAGDVVQINKHFLDYKFSHLLDTTSIKKLIQGRKREPVSPYPMACLKNNGELIEDSCRIILCPTGKARIGGVCIFPSKRWIKDGFAVNVKLEYITSNTSVLRMLKKKEVLNDEIVNAFRKTNPWSSDWIIENMFHTTEDYHFNPLLAVCLLTKISRPKMITAHIKASMRRQWNIVLNGIGIAFEQSFLQYTLLPGFKYEPDWSRNRAEFETDINVPDNALTSWGILWQDLTYKGVILTLNKLLICEQISLLKNEYTVMTGGKLLINRLTNETLFSMEFELVEDDDGELAPRICLSDSPFSLQRENNGAQTLSIMLLNLVWVIHLLQLACAANIFRYR